MNLNSVIKNKSNSLIILLIAVAVILGVLIINKKTASTSIDKEKPSAGSQVTPTQQSGERVFTERRPTPTGLSSDEIALMNPPRPDASQEEKTKHFEVVLKLAEDAEVLRLNDCNKATPLVLKVKPGQDLKVENSESVDHTIAISQDHTFKIPAGTTTTIKAEFGKDRGAFGYICDNIGGVVGFFLLMPDETVAPQNPR
jgi:plastocyanin